MDFLLKHRYNMCMINCLSVQISVRSALLIDVLFRHAHWTPQYIDIFRGNTTIGGE